MKKIMKAAIAAGAAGALLLGGAGTMALWSASDDVDAGTVSTGHLTLDASAAGTWSDISVGAATTTFVPGTDHIVPGDVLAYSQTVTIGADGKNLKGDLVATGLTGGSALPAGVSIDVDVDDSAVGVSQDAGGIITFGAADTYEVPVTVTLTFDEAATGSMDAAIDLGSMSLTLNQVRP